MTIEITQATVLIAATVISAGIVGSATAVVKHIGNENKHPPTDKIVFTKTCDAEMTGLRNCFEAKLDSVNKQLGTMDKKSDKILDILINGKGELK